MSRCAWVLMVLWGLTACDRGSNSEPDQPVVEQPSPTVAPELEPAPSPAPAPAPAPAAAPSEPEPEPAATAPTPTAAPPPPPMPELYADGFYRSEGGRVIIGLPDSIAEDGKLEFSTADGNRMLSGKSEDGATTLFVTILPPGDYNSAAAALQLRNALAASMAATIDLDTLPLRKVDAEGPGGHVYGFRHGPHTNGAICTIAVIADGRDAAIVLALGSEASTDGTVTYLLEHVRVGSKVPKLDDLHPSQRIEGTYTTRVKAVDGSLVAQWLMLDPRGYLHDAGPRNDANLEMAAMVQGAVLGLWKAYSYDLRDGQIVLTPLHPGAQARTAPITHAGDKLVLDNIEFTRVDGMIADGSTFQGTWEYYNGSSLPSMGGEYMGASTTKRFTFGPGNAISFRGGTSIIGSSVNEVGLLDSTLSAYASDGTWSGTYEVRGGRLIVKTTEGVTLTQPIAAVLFNGAKSEKSVTIGGLIYNKD